MFYKHHRETVHRFLVFGFKFCAWERFQRAAKRTVILLTLYFRDNYEMTLER